MADPLRHRQTKGAATDMVDLRPPRHIPTLPLADSTLLASKRKKLPGRLAKELEDRILKIIGWVTPAQSRLSMQLRCLPKLGPNAKTP
jgi:hypothetical protein